MSWIRNECETRLYIDENKTSESWEANPGFSPGAVVPSYFIEQQSKITRINYFHYKNAGKGWVVPEWESYVLFIFAIYNLYVIECPS